MPGLHTPLSFLGCTAVRLRRYTFLIVRADGNESKCSLPLIILWSGVQVPHGLPKKLKPINALAHWLAFSLSGAFYRCQTVARILKDERERFCYRFSEPCVLLSRNEKQKRGRCLRTPLLCWQLWPTASKTSRPCLTQTA